MPKQYLSLFEIQSISLEILRNVAKICEEENLRYFLAYGTLLGAVRHQNFIPWDDDLDILMPKEDHDKLITLLQEQPERLPHYKLFTPDLVPAYPYMITRISDDRYAIEMENEAPYGMGVFIDIYPYEGLGDTIQEALKLGLKGDRLSSLCYQSSRKHFAMETTSGFLRKLLKLPVFLFAKCIGKDYFQKKLKALSGKIPFDQSNYVGCLTWLSTGEKDIYQKKHFADFIYLPFADTQFRVPKHYHEVLSHGYGDYMQLPPEEKRIAHHFYKAYKK